MTGVKREAQRRRTRHAIVLAAAALLRDGATPSMSDVAEAADVSRRTVYLYFSSIEHLLADAALEAVRETVEPQFALTDDVFQRVESMVRAVWRNIADTETLGRTIIKHTVETRPGDGTAPRRGYRRVHWIELALEPVRSEVAPELFERLVSSLTLVIGWEALLVLRDTRGLSQAQAEEAAVWAARSLLAATLGRDNPVAAG